MGRHDSSQTPRAPERHVAVFFHRGCAVDESNYHVFFTRISQVSIFSERNMFGWMNGGWMEDGWKEDGWVEGGWMVDGGWMDGRMVDGRWDF